MARKDMVESSVDEIKKKNPLMGIRKKCDGSFVLTFAVAKVRFGDITTAKVFIKNLFILFIYAL